MDAQRARQWSATRPRNLGEEECTSARPPLTCEVLVVDDDDVVRALIVTLLRRAGVVNVSACSTPPEAFAACKTGVVDVLLVDRHLGSHDGIALMDRVRRTAPRGGPLMVMLTGDDDPLAARRALAVGASSVVTKPVDPGRLALQIDCLLRFHTRDGWVGVVRGAGEANDPCEQIHETGSVSCATTQTPPP